MPIKPLNFATQDQNFWGVIEKQDVLKSVEELPDHFTLEVIMDRLIWINKIKPLLSPTQPKN